MKIGHLKIDRRLAAAGALALMLSALALADDAAPGLKLPADLKPAEIGASGGTEAAPKPGRQYREQHIGGRLESVTITRENGWSETYRNRRGDTIWSAPENEIGEAVNLRQWIIRAW